jgi:hypothetical protein
LELAIARFVARSKKIEMKVVVNSLGLGGVIVSYIYGVKILFYKSIA